MFCLLHRQIYTDKYTLTRSSQCRHKCVFVLCSEHLDTRSCDIPWKCWNCRNRKSRVVSWTVDSSSRYLQMNADAPEELVGGVPGEEGHKHVLGKHIMPLSFTSEGRERDFGRARTCSLVVSITRAFGTNKAVLVFLMKVTDVTGMAICWRERVRLAPDDSAGSSRGDVPSCLCRRLWSGNRSSYLRRTSCPDTKCPSAGHTCNLWTGTGPSDAVCPSQAATEHKTYFAWVTRFCSLPWTACDTERLSSIAEKHVENVQVWFVS